MDPGQFFTTSASLVDLVDIVLRDGRKLFGVLRSYDHFGTIERLYAPPNLFADQYHGVFLIRGENVVLMGEIDLETEDEVPLQRADFTLVQELHRDEMERKKRRERLQQHILRERGFGVDATIEADVY